MRNIINLVRRFCLRKQCIHVLLGLLSLYAVIGIDSDILPLVPSLFSNRTTVWINIILLIVAALYLLIAPLFIFKSLRAVRQGMTIGIYLFLIVYIPVLVVIILIPMYEFTCTKILSKDVTLEEFGTLFAGITGLLAFWGVLYSLYISEQRATRVEIASRNRFNEDSERNLFSQLLGLYQRQVDSLSYNREIGTKTFREIGAEAFRNYLYIFDEEFCSKILLTDGCTKDQRETIQKLDDMISKKTVFEQSSKCTNVNSPEKKKISIDIVKKYNYETLYSKIHSCYDSFFEKNEHLLGQYFRTVYYLLDTIKDFKNKERYSKIFRSQLSRYELVLLLYNSLGSKSNPDVIQLYEDNDIFNNLEFDDLPQIESATYDGIKEKEKVKNAYIKQLFTLFRSEYK